MNYGWKKENSKLKISAGYGISNCIHYMWWFLSFSFLVEYEEDDDSGSEGSAVGTNIRSSVKEAAVSQMEAAVEALSRELAKLRTGRASPGQL